MSTAQSLVNEALELLNLNEGFSEIDPRHQKITFKRLVDVLILHRAEGRYIAPQIPATINTDVREKPWARLGLIYDTAMHASVPLQVKDFPVMFSEMRDRANKTLYINAKASSSPEYPSILPIGGGNEYEQFSDYSFYGKPDGINYDVYEGATKGEAFIYYADFDADAVSRGTSVSSVAWDTLNSGNVAISNTSLSGNVASSLASFSEEGSAKFKATATYASGEKKDFFFNIEVRSAD